MKLDIEDASIGSHYCLHLFPVPESPSVDDPSYDDFVLYFLRLIAETPDASVAPCELSELFDDEQGVEVTLPDFGFIISWDLIGYWRVVITSGSMPLAVQYFQRIGSA
jgi:hypothetical protein